jgi:hypothetical protein
MKRPTIAAAAGIVAARDTTSGWEHAGCGGEVRLSVTPGPRTARCLGCGATWNQTRHCRWRLPTPGKETP